LRQRRRGGSGAVGQGSVGRFFFFARELDECRHVQGEGDGCGRECGEGAEWAAEGARRCDSEGLGGRAGSEAM
jgi:hypothetical protein